MRYKILIRSLETDIVKTTIRALTKEQYNDLLTRIEVPEGNYILLNVYPLNE